jgi:hypothetical protein
MDLQNLNEMLQNESKTLNIQIEKTRESWNDPVQRRFYNDFMSEYQRGAPHLWNQISELDNVISKAKSVIDNL